MSDMNDHVFTECAMCNAPLKPEERVSCRDCMEYAVDCVKPMPNPLDSVIKLHDEMVEKKMLCPVCGISCPDNDKDTCKTGAGRIHWSCYERESEKDARDT